MGVICFSDSGGKDTWHVAGWAFRQVLDDVSRQYAHDLEIVEKLEQSKLHSGLILDLLEPSLQRDLRDAINDVASGIRAGTIASGITDQPYGDAVTVEQYLGSLDELLRISHASEPNRC
jgi:hypothetical protein